MFSISNLNQIVCFVLFGTSLYKSFILAVKQVLCSVQLMELSVSQVYTSVACNRTPEIVDWNSDGLICYGASNAVIIYDTKVKGKDPHTVLSHHSGRVNSVKWLRKPDGLSTELVSCSADKSIIIWTLEDGVWTATATLVGHNDAVMCVHGTYYGDRLLIFSGSIDSTIKIWERSEDGTTQFKQSIPLQSGLCLTLHCHILPIVNQPILFAALDDHKIHVFTGEDFHRVHQMVGHEDWVRGLDVLALDESSIILASCSQDTYIRLWRIQSHTEDSSIISVEKKVFQAYGERWEVKLDAVLGGHEGWVYGVHWHPPVVENGKTKVVQSLLSSSLDKSLIVWEPEASGAWVERVRLGEVGGSGLGFYGSRFGPKGEVLAHGYNGSFHIWKCCEETKQWQPSVVCGGHFNSVEDVRWEPRGRYIMSVSADQTTRVHAPWKKTDGTTEWHELARPQVHGYDMQSLALINSTVFASAAEEKVIRVFAAPHNFVQNFQNITGEVIERSDKEVAEGASVPSLGLSNKAVFSGEEGAKDTSEDDGYFVPMNLTEPPTEETLMQNTLWPEQQKLYGHGYEVFALAASPDGTMLASACRANNLEHAALILWDTKTWNQIQTLPSHTLTVTQIEFSPNSQHLLSVSRDRRWTLFQRQPGTNSFELAACTDKTNGVHARIVWCCAWSADGEVFSTGSRDGKVCVWSKTEVQSDTSLKDYGLHGKALDLKQSVTALAFAPLEHAGSRVVAVGTETGTVRLYGYDGVWSMLRELDHSAAHHLTVRRLAFKPRREADGALLLASCGSDHLVRIHRISIT